jgi:hypothetical protein
LDADFLLDLVLNHDVVGENEMHAVGVTWTSEGAVAAAAVLDALADRGVRNVVVVSDTDAAEALATGIANITDYDDVAVCIIEPDAALVALVNAGGVTVERIDRPMDRNDALELTSSVIAMLAVNDRRPDAIFVVGSDDVDVIVSSFEAISEAPVFSAAEADLALARGAALASAGVVNAPNAESVLLGPRVTSKVGVLSAVLGAAVVTFLVSLSVALGLGVSPDSTSEQPMNVNAGESAPNAAPASVPRAAPSHPRPIAPSPAATTPEAVPELAETIKVAAPPAPAYVPPAPAYVPPAPAYVPPAPAYVPPPPPAYVPPAMPPGYVPPTYQEPRLRDRIIERIPIINRFHEPGR